MTRLRFQLHPFGNRTDVDKTLNRATSIVAGKLASEGILDFAKEDGNDIISELIEDLAECKEKLFDTQFDMAQFKICVHNHVEDAENQIWDFENSLDEDAAGSRSLSLFMPLIILSVLITV